MSDLVKITCLVILVLQTVSNVLIIRNARHHHVSVPFLVVLQEIFKLATCLAVLSYNEGFTPAVSSIKKNVFGDLQTTFKVGIPAFLYVIQNQLLFVSLANLDAATYQVTYQLKILTTAAFSVIILNKTIAKMQWASLLMLTIGVAFVQWKGSSTPDSGSDGSQLVGLSCILLACCTSGFSGVFLEKMIKNTNQSLWIRNFQLAFCSVLVGTVNLIFSDLGTLLRDGFFTNFAPIVVAAVISQAYGGLLIGMVMKYADNIVKVFTTSISIIISSFISIFYFRDLQLTLTFAIGSALVCGATVTYAHFASRPYKPTYILRKTV